MANIIVSNASPIRYLARIKTANPSAPNLDLLYRVYDAICITPAVKKDLSIDPSNHEYGNLENFLCDVRILPIADKNLFKRLMQQYKKGKGETETFVLSKELKVKALLANRGAEYMFQEEEQDFLNVLHFGENCLNKGILSLCQFKCFLMELWNDNYTPKKYRHIFQKYNIPYKGHAQSL